MASAKVRSRGPGELIHLAGVTVGGQGGHGDVGDVVGVDERLARVSDRQDHLAAEDSDRAGRSG